MDTHSLAIQSWAFYALAISIIFARLIFRRIMLKSFADLQADDWIMVSLLLPFTAFIVLTNLVSNSSTQQQRTHRYVLEELQLVITCFVKVCLLILYWRIFPVAFSILRRRYVQIVSAICVISFLIIQISLLSWCQPAHMEDNPHCLTYHNHTIVSLTLSTLTTFLVLILPTPFIPTPRRFLLAILTATGTLTLVFGIFARCLVLTAPDSRTYLFFYITEPTLLIIFANLPFLASLVVSTAPARIREFGRSISFLRDGGDTPLSPWPRSRRASVPSLRMPPLGASLLESTTTVMGGEPERKEWTITPPVTRPGSVKSGFETWKRSSSNAGWPLPG
ncbi:uncharacterized protein EKO05_0005301 [Ascochyta rabiei]|uniref:uncharacterized protein n=1 Tax=Didymella rabiei TaxID=5454 RepID=UPI0019023EF0|nr:uncharacterized protein EKO05_0005301 [Ascochyta rabiei]UPX14830.1 hypothetical protein EKO05_0005301 [Ascochyta rabiei]